MKKIFAIILTALMITSLTACSEKESGPNDNYINISGDNTGIKPENSSNTENSSNYEDSSSTDNNLDTDNITNSEDNSNTDDSNSNDSPNNEDNSNSEDNQNSEDNSKPEDTSSKPEDTSKPETPSALPLANYPDRSYYTKDGKECDDHSDCDWLHDCNCINFDNSIQAFAFARYVYFTVTGDHLGDKTEVNADITAETARAMFKDLPEGSYIAVQTKEGSPHAMIVISSTDSDITVYQANYGGKCLVTAPTYTWEEFAKRFPHINNYAK